MTIIYSAGVDEEASQIVNDGLLAYNSQATNETLSSFNIYAKDSSGNVIGGIESHIDSNAVYVTALWVSLAARKQRIGSELLEKIEKEGKKRGCAYIKASTFAFQAPAFYEKHGYETVGILPDYVKEHATVLMRKSLK